MKLVQFLVKFGTEINESDYLIEEYEFDPFC